MRTTPLNPSAAPVASRIFWGSFFAMVTCAFGFIIRTQVIDSWQVQFNLSETEKGEILGVGFWPFAFSIIILSLVIDRIGYRTAAAIGLFLHLSSTVILLTAHSAAALYWGTFVFALSNGTVEAYINPTISALYPREKVKWLNLLHAGWPGGMVLAGILGISLGAVDWRVKIALTFVPVVAYTVILWRTRFPVSERVAAGITYREMLADFGAGGAFVAVYLIALQVFQGILGIEHGQFLWPLLPAAVIALIFGRYVRSWGRGMYFVLLLIMIPLATTELGIDSWITDLMGPEMRHIGLNAGWVLVYTAGVMAILRFNAGVPARLLSPLAILACGAALAATGLISLSHAVGLGVLLAATLYGLGKAYFWSTTLGVVGDQFPRGGALTLNSIGGIGMLGLSVGMVFLGNVQDRRISRDIIARDAQMGTHLQARYLTVPKKSIFGPYLALDQNALQQATAGDLAQIDEALVQGKKEALRTAALFPMGMLAAYLGLLLYFRSRGGYRVHVLAPLAAAEGAGPL